MSDATPPPPKTGRGVWDGAVQGVFLSLLILNTVRGCVNTNAVSENNDRLERIEEQNREIRAMLESRPK